jgi:hypothetical protein
LLGNKHFKDTFDIEVVEPEDIGFKSYELGNYFIANTM